LEGNESFGSEIFWEVVGASAPSLILNSLDLILSILAVVFMIVGTIWLAKSAKPGSRYLVLGLAGTIVGALVYVAYLLIGGDEKNVLLEDFLSLFISACAAMWGYGYLRLCGFLKREHVDGAVAKAPGTSR
jgi:hypothetical protein